MAIYSAVPPPPEQAASTGTTTASHAPHHHHQLSNASTASVDIEAWTVSALEALSVSPVARGTGNPLSIPLDDHLQQRSAASADGNAAPRMKLRHVKLDVDTGATITPPRRPPSRRDSLRRRDALLKGNEGSRQRRRWENDRLVHVPNVEPPLAIDWQVGPTHPVHHVPYQLAQYWDKGLRERVEERKAAFASASRRRGKAGSKTMPETGRVPRELRETAKRAPAVKGWLRVLEEPVRRFLVERGAAVDQTAEEKPEAAGETDSDDEEIVFTGRKSLAERDQNSWKKARKEGPGHEAEPVMVLDSPADDETSAFKRWLTHSISDYYGLDSRSVSIGNPARRVVYIGIRHLRHDLPARFELPQPLWELF